MAEVMYVGPHDEVYVPELGTTVSQGDPVEVTDPGLLERLLDQPANWQAPGSRNDPTVDDILSAVGDDPDAARAALAAEQNRPKPRKSLVSKLEEIIDAEPKES